MKLLPGCQNIKRTTIPLAIAKSVEHECRKEKPQADNKYFKYVLRIVPKLITPWVGIP